MIRPRCFLVKSVSKLPVEWSCSGLMPASISCCTCHHGCCCGSISACRGPQLSHRSAGGGGTHRASSSALTLSQFSLSLAAALGDKRRLDQSRQLGQPRAIKTPVSVLRQRGQMGPTSTQTQTKGPHIHQGAWPHLHPNEAGVEGSMLPSPR